MIIFLLVLLALFLFTIAELIYFFEKGRLPALHPYKKVKAEDIKVACVGDSITYGSGHISTRNYPAYLSKLLGSGYCVNNFGYSGRTVMKTGDFPYTNEKTYKQSLEFNPDVVIIMFGTNDSKPYNWKGVDVYLEDYLSLVNSYKALPSNPEIYIIAPPPAFEVNGNPVMYDINGEIIANEIRPAIKAFAKDKGLHFIDMYPVFIDHPELYEDGVHPNYKGALLFASTIYKEIQS